MERDKRKFLGMPSASVAKHRLNKTACAGDIIRKEFQCNSRNRNEGECARDKMSTGRTGVVVSVYVLCGYYAYIYCSGGGRSDGNVYKHSVLYIFK